VRVAVEERAEREHQVDVVVAVDVLQVTASPALHVERVWVIVERPARGRRDAVDQRPQRALEERSGSLRRAPNRDLGHGSIIDSPS
jgi:hypothetical protein